jgi:hypothetical protein
MEDGAGKRKSAKRQKEKSKSGGGKNHGRKTVFWLGASVFSFLDERSKSKVQGKGAPQKCTDHAPTTAQPAGGNKRTDSHTRKRVPTAPPKEAAPA